jgi:nitric oxide reductase NorE protein
MRSDPSPTDIAGQTDTPARTIPGEAGIWVLVLGDMAVFGLFFATFTFYRAQNVALYVQSQAALDQASGLINTVLLLTSSWFAALAVQAVRANEGNRSRTRFALAFLCGLGFVGVKLSEYAAKAEAGIGLTTNEFFTFYFMFTGIHLLHVLIGLGVLAYARHRAGRVPLGPADGAAVESCAIFWHLVDILWIVLFAIFYLMR